MGYRIDEYEHSIARLDHVRFGLKPQMLQGPSQGDMREIQGDGVFWLLRTLFQNGSQS